MATDFVDLYPYESFVQTHLQTDYIHGRITPAITAIVGSDGMYAFPMDVTYRFNDSLLFDLQYVHARRRVHLPDRVLPRPLAIGVPGDVPAELSRAVALYFADYRRRTGFRYSGLSSMTTSRGRFHRWEG